MRIDRVVVAGAACLLLGGCAMKRLKAEAGIVLNCSEADITLVEKQPGRYAAYGCGRMAVCEAPEGAHPNCAGGAEAQPPPDLNQPKQEE